MPVPIETRFWPLLMDNMGIHDDYQRIQRTMAALSRTFVFYPLTPNRHESSFPLLFFVNRIPIQLDYQRIESHTGDDYKCQTKKFSVPS